MNRSKRYKKRETSPDIVYNSVSISRFIGKLNKHGKKSKASKFIYSALSKLSNDLNKPALEIFEEAIIKIYPKYRLRPWRIASRVYPLPYLIKDNLAANKQAIHWLSTAVRQRKERGMANKIFAEIKDLLNGSGIALSFWQRRNELAIEYEAYVHYGT